MKKKSIRTKGKLSFSKYFQEFNDGDKVSFVKELSIPSNIPDRYQGRTGIVDGKRGRSYIVLINDNDKPKKFIIQPIHLRKIKT